MQQLEERWSGEDVTVFVLPVDIGSVNYGRGVGYDIVEWVPPADVADISATKLREPLYPGAKTF